MNVALHRRKHAAIRSRAALDEVVEAAHSVLLY